MSRLSNASLLAAASVALAACADSAKVTEPAALAAPSAASYDQLAWENTRHEMPTQSQASQNAKPGGNGGSGTGIYYHGGRVLQAYTNVAAVYWASSTIYPGGPTPGASSNLTVGATDNSNVGYFMANLGGSSYFNINTTYTDAAGTPIANVVNYTQFWANNTNAPSGTTSISDAQIVAMLQSGFNSGALTYEANTVYAVFTSGKVNLGGGFGTQYCAYHYNGTVTIGGVSRTVLYAAMPYNYAYPSACSANLSVWPNNDPGADAEVNTLAHEIEEATTDPLGTAWWDRRGYENADKCAWNFGTTYPVNGSVANTQIGGKHFLVQMNWVNAGSGGCAIRY